MDAPYKCTHTYSRACIHEQLPLWMRRITKKNDWRVLEMWWDGGRVHFYSLAVHFKKPKHLLFRNYSQAWAASANEWCARILLAIRARALYKRPLEKWWWNEEPPTKSRNFQFNFFSITHPHHNNASIERERESLSSLIIIEDAWIAVFPAQNSIGKKVGSGNAAKNSKSKFIGSKWSS